MKKETLALLEKYEQTHLLAFYDQMDDVQKENFEKQLDTLDWGVFDCFGNDNTPEGKGKIDPIGALSIADIEKKKEEYKEVFKLLKAGYPIRKVAKLTDVSESTVKRLKKEFCVC